MNPWRAHPRRQRRPGRRRAVAQVAAVVAIWLGASVGVAVSPGSPAAQQPFGLQALPSVPVLPASPSAQAPGPGGFPPEISGDRPRLAPDPLREGRILPDSGVEVGVGGLFVSIESHVLQFKQGPQTFSTDGGIVSADVVLGNWRLSYSKVLLRRSLESGAQYKGTPVDFVGVDVDQFWAYYGFRPTYFLYLGAGLAYEYRLTRLSDSGINVLVASENLAAAGLIADWAVSPPFVLEARVFQEDGGHLVTISGWTFQLAYIVPF